MERVTEIVMKLEYIILDKCQEHRSNVRVGEDGERHRSDCLERLRTARPTSKDHSEMQDRLQQSDPTLKSLWATLLVEIGMRPFRREDV